MRENNILEQPVFNSDEYLFIRALQFGDKDLGQLHKMLSLEEFYYQFLKSRSKRLV